MLTSDFDYNLPKELIAQAPVEPRDSSRLMVINRKNKTVEHSLFRNLGDYLHAGDLLVWNNSKVFNARLNGVVEIDQAVAGTKIKQASDLILNIPKVEIFLLRPSENRGVWKVLAKPARKLRLGMKIIFAEDFFCQIIAKEADGTLLVQFADDDLTVREKANRYGQVPTPPYIKITSPFAGLAEKYQTVYAKKEGSVAAPTAGFHFTSDLIEGLKLKGVEFAEVTLHVGLGTFQPVKTKKIEEHVMHPEWAEITDKNAEIINRARSEGRRVIAVGTTTVRALESTADDHGVQRTFNGEINIFIYPGYKFKTVDALITNFHLPKSTLIMLVAAFAKDKKFMLDCYENAVKNNYRFYSFGDAMLIY